jgi:hypothetical protein
MIMIVTKVSSLNPNGVNKCVDVKKQKEQCNQESMTKILVA